MRCEGKSTSLRRGKDLKGGVVAVGNGKVGLKCWEKGICGSGRETVRYIRGVGKDGKVRVLLQGVMEDEEKPRV